MLFVLVTAGCGSRGADTAAIRSRVALTWMTVATDSGVVRVAVARPSGPGPFPAVLILHGTHGFAEEYVELARDLARQGILGFAACWFDGGTGTGQRFVTPIACEGGPRFVDAPGLERFRLSRITIDALVKALLASPDTRILATFGHSRGGGAALDYALSNPHGLSALILNSAGYPDEVIARAATLALPVLVLHGVADDPADGGSAMTIVTRARRFEEALRRGGGAVESKYYAGGHNSLFTDTTEYNDAVRRIADFVHRRATK
ncbi:MAG TPA: alpha/beta hydrolase [Longimicrobiales bacterium]